MTSNLEMKTTDVVINIFENALRNPVLRRKQLAKQSILPKRESVNWEVVLQVLEKLRIEANTSFNTNNQPREKSSIAISLQSFLSLAFMVALPTVHPKIYCQLEVGKTFLKGLYHDGVFIPEFELKNSDSALWYIYSPPIEYKTGQCDEWWRMLPNTEFVDGTKLYEYIDEWLNNQRECKHKCDHDYFFIGTKDSRPLTEERWSRKIINSFNRHCGVPINPKELTKSYITYLKNRGAS
jgi:hypothetical protein